MHTVVNWKLKLLDDEAPPMWHPGVATRYAAHTNVIHVSIPSVGEGEEELCFEYMRLESCDAKSNSGSAQALFERLMAKQAAWVAGDRARGEREQQLRDAAMDGDVARAQALLAAAAAGGADATLDIDSQDDLQRTALILASAFGRAELVRMLLDAGAADLQDNYGHTALSWATTQSHKAVRTLLEKHDFDAAAAAREAGGGINSGGGAPAAPGVGAVTTEGSGGSMTTPVAPPMPPPGGAGGAAMAAAPTPVVSEGGPLTQQQYLARVVHSDATKSVELSRCKFRYAFLSQRGFYPESPTKANQDACFCSIHFNDDPDGAFFGVFDGHGAQGDLCAQFARDNVQSRLATHRAGNPAWDGAHVHKAFVEANESLHTTPYVDDSLSGTTAVTCYIRDGGTLEVANAGDSRIIIVSKDPGSGKLSARPLSIDQTPFRKDERERCKRSGARVMTMDQLDGLEPIHENWGLNLGEEIDDIGDPPRIWHPHGQYPGCAFTRSIGDQVSEALGVYAEPEIESHVLQPGDQYVNLSSPLSSP